MCPHNVNNIQWFSCVAKGNFLMLYLYFYRKDQEKRGSVFLILTVIIIEFLLKYSIQCHEKTGFDHSNGNCLENCSVHGTRYNGDQCVWIMFPSVVTFSTLNGLKIWELYFKCLLHQGGVKFMIIHLVKSECSLHANYCWLHLREKCHCFNRCYCLLNNFVRWWRAAKNWKWPKTHMLKIHFLRLYLLCRFRLYIRPLYMCRKISFSSGD